MTDLAVGKVYVGAGQGADCANFDARGRAEADMPAHNRLMAGWPGQDIVVSKWIGLKGTMVLAGQYEKSLRERYPAWLFERVENFASYLSTEAEAEIAAKAGATIVKDVAEGGIFAALWELAETNGLGLTVDLKKLPIRQETVEICNHCDVNPYELLAGGCLLMTSEDGTALAAALEAEGIPAAVVGKVTDSNDKLILKDDEVSYLNRPRKDAVYEPDIDHGEKY